MRRCLVLAGLMVLLPAIATADDVLLRSGGKISGRILQRSETSVQVDVGPGIITVPMTSVLSIEEKRTTLDDHEERAARLRANDAPGWLELANWAASEGLNTQARRAYEKVVSIDPQHADANRALGRVLVDGRWVSEQESYRARGLVSFEGEWITPGERDAILRERESRLADLTRIDAERRAREAEARAADAEARAREAEASARYGAGLSLWYGGGWWPGYVGSAPRGRGKWGNKRETWPPNQAGRWPSMGTWPSYPMGTWPSSLSPPSYPIGPAGNFPIGQFPRSAGPSGSEGNKGVKSGHRGSARPPGRPPSGSGSPPPAKGRPR